MRQHSAAGAGRLVVWFGNEPNGKIVSTVATCRDMVSKRRVGDIQAIQLAGDVTLRDSGWPDFDFLEGGLSSKWVKVLSGMMLRKRKDEIPRLPDSSRLWALLTRSSCQRGRAARNISSCSRRTSRDWRSTPAASRGLISFGLQQRMAELPGRCSPGRRPIPRSFGIGRWHLARSMPSSSGRGNQLHRPRDLADVLMPCGVYEDAFGHVLRSCASALSRGTSKIPSAEPVNDITMLSPARRNMPIMSSDASSGSRFASCQLSMSSQAAIGPDRFDQPWNSGWTRQSPLPARRPLLVLELLGRVILSTISGVARA